MRKPLLFILLAAAVAAAWLTSLVDKGLGMDWPHMAVRNWEQYGLLHLHGKLVTNPGGFDVDTHPEIYPGHRPASLYPVYLCHRLFLALGIGGLGFMAYYAVVAALVLLSIWWLLGRTERAFWLGAIAVITPGFIRWQVSLDPNLTAVLFGFAFCVAVVTLLRRPSLSWAQVAMLFALIMVYSTLNWTTVFVHAMLFATLLVLSRVPRRHLFIYAGLTAAMAGWVLLASVANKMTRSDGSSAGMGSMLQAYGWGDIGYGQGMTTKTALLRLMAANGVGLLPVLVCLAWAWLRHGGRPASARALCVLPFLVAALEVLGMRNYFGHHPWMSVHFILLGVILAIVVWMDRTEPASAISPSSLPLPITGLAAAFVYSVVVLSIANAHNERAAEFALFVHKETSRDTTIVIRRDTDAALADLAGRLSNLVDRHIVVVSSSVELLPAILPPRWILLTTKEESYGEFARTTLAEHTSPLVGPLLDWYSSHIAHRQKGDKLEIPGETLFLYQTPS